MMDSLKLSDSFVEASDNVQRSYQETEFRPVKIEEFSEEPKGNHEQKPVINVQVQNLNLLSLPDSNTWRSNSSDSEWKTTTDTSICSSPSPNKNVPYEVLEACDGLDDATLDNISDASPLPDAQRVRGRGRGNGRGRGRGNRSTTGAEVKPRRTTRKPYEGRKKMPSTSSSSSSFSKSGSSSDTDSDSESESGSSCCSGTCSHSSCSSYDSSSTCTNCDYCSCSCHSDTSYTSFESTDGITSLPRAKKGQRQLGPRGGKKVADKCAQS